MDEDHHSDSSVATETRQSDEDDEPKLVNKKSKTTSKSTKTTSKKTKADTLDEEDEEVKPKKRRM